MLRHTLAGILPAAVPPPSPVRLVLLSRDPGLYSTRRLVEAGRKRGHRVRVLDPLRCYMRIGAPASEIHYRGRPLGPVDGVVARVGVSITFYGAAVVRQFETTGVPCLNDSDALLRARDKLLALQRLSHAGIPVPPTGMAHVPDDTDDLLELVGTPPVVIKLLEGSQGLGVVLSENRQAAESVIDAFRNLRAHFLVQRFVAEARGRDLRCFVIGGRVAAAMMRIARPGEFRANLHRGAEGRRVRLSREERTTAEAAATILGLDVAGVDLLRTTQGPLVLEVNAVPGLEGIETTTGLDLAGAMIEALEEKIRRRSSRSSPAATGDSRCRPPS